MRRPGTCWPMPTLCSTSHRNMVEWGGLNMIRRSASRPQLIPPSGGNAVNPSLMASAVLGSSSAAPGMFCHHCQEVDHMPRDCALVSTDPFMEPARTRCQAPSPVSLRSFRPHPFDFRVDVCRRYNRGVCNDPASCKYRHVCSECRKECHGAFTCHRQDTLKKLPAAPRS